MQTANADQAEVDKFSALASSWWDPNGELKTLHDINPLRLDWIREQAGGLNGRRILDVGCGAGLLSEAMAIEGAEVTGIDLAGESLQVARLHGLETGVKVDYQQASAEEHAADHPAQYDLVTCMELLEHVPDPASVVRACGALVRPGGLVCFSTLNRNPKAFMLAILGAEYLLRMLPRGTHSYEHFIKPSELAAAARAAGLEPAALAGLEYNPLTRHYRVTRDTSVNYMMAARRPD
ncbi:bifunctional 2-polyprenyl-6-hydroxyphenol methylase/3-demethylubiquinol 3-O-methyltransferase UbiG [Castellaniella sp. S9]|uniref:bifunctional 2-polyprenyl-6-hydroxyphenol methylase/3-demethylubiquinol 3-O-methyltransferase UbiG n=1 Tax=Castellaniella sp. S9 TaxID=2993652 RepID=UPI0022B4F8BE|nr:bifunctional 2-polyprenyl-6-hydroxyphenol methylase/3-demethylubiquinol 3-O-methyltransferase UbiG [Castellaniella sp. S9]